MRSALPLLLWFASAVAAQLPTDGRASYARDDRIQLPFDLRTNDRATKVTLYSSYEDGPWLEFDSMKPGNRKGFTFKADRDGLYAFATMTTFADGTTDPHKKDQLVEQKRVIVDRTPPNFQSIRASLAADGSPGLEWDVYDKYMDPRGIKLEFRWDGQGSFGPIEKGTQFAARDSMHWKLKPKDRMQVRVIATDRAGNKTESDPIWVTGKDADRWGGDEAPAMRATTSGPRDTNVTPATGTVQPTLHYVNDKTVQVKVNANVGPSGLEKASLWWADEKLEWQKWKDDVGPLPAPPSTTADSMRRVPVDFTFVAQRDGLYHFVVVVKNHREANRPDPKKGTIGDVQVMVDTTKPVVELISTRPSPNGDRGAIVDIRWKATDANIAPVPIKLEYRALRADKPGDVSGWKEITPGWIDNTGQHTWSAPPISEAHEFHIRVTCKDRAGNENSVETTKPVNIDLSKPGVEAVEVRPGISDMSIIPGPPKK
ncbi:MAG TPA: hypothetical protein VHR66_21420 [Gemmataceae bacterium]|nr:hypothetical protein [Gemmataceae bacterium]